MRRIQHDALAAPVDLIDFGKAAWKASITAAEFNRSMAAVERAARTSHQTFAAMAKAARAQANAAR